MQVTQRLRPGPPLTPAPSGLAKMPTFKPLRPPGQSFTRVGSSAAIRRLVHTWARETLSGRELPRPGARGGYWLGPDLCGHRKHAAPGWEFAFWTPLLIGQRREYGRRKLTRMGTGRLGRKPTPKEGEGEGGLLERSFVFLSPSRFQTVFYASWRLWGGDPGWLLSGPLRRPGRRGQEDLSSSLGGQGSRVRSLGSAVG